MNSKLIKSSYFILFIFLCFITNCVSYVKPVDENLLFKKFPFIVNERTTKHEILSKLGEPYLRYKKDNIWIYVTPFDEDINTEYNLVLVFHENGLLSKHSLVKF
jgi:hypothetical protein